MKKTLVSLILLSFTLVGCNNSQNINNIDFDNQNISALKSKRVKLNTDKKVTKSNMTLNKEKKVLKLKDSGKKKPSEILNITYEPVTVKKNSRNDHIVAIRIAFESMSKAHDYNAGWKLSNRIMDSVRDDLVETNDPDWGMKNLLDIPRSIEGSMNHETWYKVNAVALKAILDRGNNTDGTSISESELAQIGVQMMRQGYDWDDGCRVGRQVLRLFAKNDRYKFIANNTLDAPNGNISWESWYYMIKDTLNEIANF